jgi:uncharacterized protein
MNLLEGAGRASWHPDPHPSPLPKGPKGEGAEREGEGAEQEGEGVEQEGAGREHEATLDVSAAATSNAKGVAEETVYFRSGTLRLEGRLDEQPGGAAVALAAPHPLYGSTMDDAVIEALRVAYRAQGFTTLRFNYRGIGGSEGVPDADAGPREDLASALAYLAERGKRRLELAGYSFGAWVAFMTVQSRCAARRAVLVAPPVDAMQFAGASDKIRLVVGAAEDHYASVESLEPLVQKWSARARLVVIPDANHYFMMKLDEITLAVQELLSGDR